GEGICGCQSPGRSWPSSDGVSTYATRHHDPRPAKGTPMNASASVVLCKAPFTHADGSIEGFITGDHVCVGGMHCIPNEEEIHLSLRGQGGNLTLIMSAASAREMALELLNVTDPRRN